LKFKIYLFTLGQRRDDIYDMMGVICACRLVRRSTRHSDKAV